MRCLHKALALFDQESPMDYCEEFDDTKSVLAYCNKHVKPFSKVHFRGGNDLFINELVRRLQETLLDRQLIDPETKKPLAKAHQKLRKILIFLFANTDATYKYNLREDPTIAHVLEQCPLLPKFLLITLVWELQLDQFFYETLSYTPCWFAFQYFETAADTMKYIEDPYEVLEKVEQLMRALLICVSRSEYRKIDMVDKKIIYNKLYDYSMNLLRQFYTPDSEKFKQFSKLQFFRYSGFALKHLLQMILFAFDLYEAPEKAKPNINVDIYEICQEICPLVPNITAVKPSDTLKEQQLKIIKALLNSLQYNVMLVKIDVFMYWVEVDITPNTTLQLSIGEMIYEVGERMRANSKFGHDVEAQLKLLAIKPKTLSETIETATLGEILRNLDENSPQHVKKAWFDELFNRSIALGNDECLEAIKEHIKLMTLHNCQQALQFIKQSSQLSQLQASDNETEEGGGEGENSEKMQIDRNDFETLTSLMLLGIQNFKSEDILQLLTFQTKLFGKSTNICCQDDYQRRVTEFLNKYANSFDFQQFLVLCFEYPSQMWSKFFECACHNSEHVRNFCKTVQQSRPFSNIYFDELLENAMHDADKLKQKKFPELLCEIYFVLYHPSRKTEFLKQFMNKNVNAFLEAQRFGHLLPIVKALNLIAAHGETQSNKPLTFGEVTAPVLLMAAQIMDKARWDLITYTDERDELVRECIQFIQYTSKRFLPVATEKDRKWITKVIKDSYRPITQYYFQKFSQTPDQPPIDFDRFLIRLEIEDKSEAEMFLIINYVRCTMKETEWLARSERLLPHISDVLIILSGVVVETDNPNAINNYRHCLTNYANIVVKFVLPPLKNDTKKIEKLMLKVLKIIESAPTQLYEEVFMSFTPLLLDIMRNCAHPLKDEDNVVKSVRKFIGSMKDCQGKELFLEKFQALVTELLT
uniref:DNA ligase n=2 Tax=Zeugodacus cucurbitae TaxID=28588 RepID=A0A0A1WG20_ZEUCU